MCVCCKVYIQVLCVCVCVCVCFVVFLARWSTPKVEGCLSNLVRHRYGLWNLRLRLALLHVPLDEEQHRGDRCKKDSWSTVESSRSATSWASHNRSGPTNVYKMQSKKPPRQTLGLGKHTITMKNCHTQQQQQNKKKLLAKNTKLTCFNLQAKINFVPVLSPKINFVSFVP